MNIIDYYPIREKYHHGFDRDQPITEIVIHGTGGFQNVSQLFEWMMGGERSKEYYKGEALFHYVIDRNGDIYQIIDLDKYVFHSTSGMHDRYTIGIEHINPDRKNGAAYTDEQYTALEELILRSLSENPMIATIIGHVQNTLKYSGAKYVKAPCPGPYFEWERLCTALNAGGYNFVLGVECLRRNV